MDVLYWVFVVGYSISMYARLAWLASEDGPPPRTRKAEAWNLAINAAILFAIIVIWR